MDAVSPPTPTTGLKQTLEADLTSAMKARDELTTATLRLALAAIRTEEVAGKSVRVLTDEQITGVLARESKKRREAAEAFSSAGRTELAERELAEGKILERYMPEQLSDDELSALVAAVIAEIGATDPKQMGMTMKAAQTKVAGRAPGGRVAAEVRRQLGAPGQ